MGPNPIKCARNKDKKFSRIYPETEGDEIVMTGMSGRFPNSKNITELDHNLYNKIDMVDDAEIRWKHYNEEIPRRSGKIHNLNRFDAKFFGVHFKQTNTMDPQCRILIETAFEAVLDAGVNPKSLRGTRTGVFIGASISESENTWYYEKATTSGFGVTGCSRAMLANRISYSLGLNGPSYLIDTACSSSIYALDSAFTAFRNGEIDAALVGGVNLNLHPFISLHYARLGVLAPDGYCRPFDQDASGYSRSEGISCIFLQKKQNAKRIYATVVYCKTNNDGYKLDGITHPSGYYQEKLLKEFYDNINIKPKDLAYLEANATGTIVGDFEECRAIDNVLCAQRDEPLPVGSIKSNLGNSEAVSGLCSLVKVALAFQKGKIAPNINFTKARKDIRALSEGRLRVVSEIENLEKPYIGVNSFGIVGSNAHVLLKMYEKEKINFGVPKDKLPRLVNWSGRTEEAVHTIFNAIETNPLDVEYIGLIHNTQRDPIPGLVFRGYGLYFHKEGKNAQCLFKDVQHYTGINRPIVWVFSGMGSQWTEMGTSLMDIPLFRQSIERCHRALVPKGVDLIKILTSTDPSTYDNILHSFVGIAAVQIAIVDILKTLEIKPDYVIGHSVGELGCAYADGGLTAEQMILSSYSRGIVSVEMEKIKGSMAAVGLGYKDIVGMLPEAIEVACHNSPDSSTISGPCQDVSKFVEELKSKGIFAKEVPCSNIAYHSRYIAHMGPALLKRLKEVIPEPKSRSPLWLSSSVPKVFWDLPENQLCSAEYHTNNLLSSVLFEETAAMLPANALTIEIAPHGLLQAILRKSMPGAVHIGLTQRANKNNMNFLFAALGKLYVNGIDFPIERLYEKIEFPVSRGTSMISPLIKWDHSEEWYIPTCGYNRSRQKGEKVFTIDVRNDSDKYLSGYAIDGKNVISPAVYLLNVWQTFSLMQYGSSFEDLPVEFEDVRFLKMVPLSKDSGVTLFMMIHYGNGTFEITQQGTLIVTGRIRALENPQPPAPISSLQSSNSSIAYSKDFYKELGFSGYFYNGAFRAVQEARFDGLWAKIKWNNNWVTFMDCLFQSFIIRSNSRALLIPKRIRKIRLNGKYHLDLVKKNDSENVLFEAQLCRNQDRIICGGIEINGFYASTMVKKSSPAISVLENYQFIPHFPVQKLNKLDAVRLCIQIVLENIPLNKLKVVEMDTEKSQPIVNEFMYALEDMPVISGDYVFLTSQQIILPNIHVEDSDLSTQINCTILIASNVLRNNEDFMIMAQKTLDDKAYLLAREKRSVHIDNLDIPVGFHKIAVFPIDDEILVLLQREEKKYFGYSTVVMVSESDAQYQWITKVQTAIDKGPVLLVSQNEKFSGILGLVNCLRKEINGHLVKCVFIDDPNAPPFDMELPFYKSHLKLGMAINIFRKGKWGTYRHLQLKQDLIEKPRKGLVLGNARINGDLSSMTWFQGSKELENYNTKVVYASLNFRDAMLETCRLENELYGESRIEQSNDFGFEYVGINRSGQRIMGIIPKGALASYIDSSKGISWNIPEYLSLEEAATIPVAYFTVYYAFFHCTNIRKGKTILIHSGTEDVGLAAITVALAYGLEIFTTCSSNEKRQYLLDTFPQLKESQIGNSCDTSFESMILKETDALGVDFVLNSLTGDKLLTSFRCVAKGGCFLQFGKLDMADDMKLGLAPFLKELTFRAVLPDNISTVSQEILKELKEIIDRDITANIIQPLPVTIFNGNKLEKAFHYLIDEKKIGKVIVKIRDDSNSEYTIPLKIWPQTYFDKNLVYIISGGLGNFGMELANWLVIRGAKKLILNSRSVLRRQYQAYRIQYWETFDVKVVINTEDITTIKGCEALITKAITLGAVGGIFNLAVCLQSANFMDQTPENFYQCIAPKAIATRYLDELSQKLCPQLQYFVIFSSVSCGRGTTTGQSNYGMANSIIERIIEDRASKGLPSKAIQWGAIEEAGHITDKVIGNKINMKNEGTIQYNIYSCLKKLDALLDSTDPILSCILIPEKKIINTNKDNIIETIMKIMKIRDLKSIFLTSSLADLGLDPISLTEIKGIMEKEIGFCLTTKDLNAMTFQKIQEISNRGEQVNRKSMKKLKISNQIFKISPLIESFRDENDSAKIIIPLIKKNGLLTSSNPFIIIPGLEGTVNQNWYNLGTKLNSEAVVVQLTCTAELETIKKISEVVHQSVVTMLKKSEPFYIISYSYGCLIAIELARLLEKSGFYGHLLFIDSSPYFVKQLYNDLLSNNSKHYDDHSLQCTLLTSVVHSMFPIESLENINVSFTNIESWNKKMEVFMRYVDKQNIFTKQHCAIITNAMYNRLKILMNLDISCIEPIHSSATLIRSLETTVIDIEKDYDLSKIVKGRLSLRYIEGDHTTSLDNPKLPEIIIDSNPFLRKTNKN